MGNTPMPGDAVRLTGPFMAPLAKTGAIGILNGMVGQARDEYTIIFHASAFRGKSNGYSGPEGVSCSGGPGTISTPTTELVATGETVRHRFWRWRTTPQAGGGEDYYLDVPLWEWRGDGGR